MNSEFKKTILFSILATGVLSANPITLSPARANVYRAWVRAVVLQSFDGPRTSIGVKALPRWQQNNRDCAGLVRYAHFEATSRHTEAYRKNPAYYLSASLPDLRPPLPRFHENAAYASASDLYFNNTRQITHDILAGGIKDADLIFFRRGSNDWHVMLLFIERETGALLAAYHTGDERNELRLIYLSDLLEHNQTEWHPHPQNKAFLGIRRLNFLN